jgi:N-methylhydantoinase A/oxoprolinase/acetone carboxylase beta subunit
MVDTPLYDFERLEPGNVIEGPAVIESPYTTIPIPEGRGFSIDSRRFGIIGAAGAVVEAQAVAR